MGWWNGWEGKIACGECNVQYNVQRQYGDISSEKARKPGSVNIPCSLRGRA